MKFLLLICFLFSHMAYPLDFDLPILQPGEVVVLANNYVLNERGIDLDRYTITSVKYNYIGKTSLSGRWDILYMAKPNDRGTVAFGDHFSVFVRNGNNPSILFSPGR